MSEAAGTGAQGLKDGRRRWSGGTVIKIPSGGLWLALEECPAGPAEPLGLPAGA